MSRYSQILKEQTLGSATTKRLADFDETDPYYFVIQENDQTIAEGSLLRVKLKLDESYLYKKIKQFSKDPTNMVATVRF